MTLTRRRFNQAILAALAAGALPLTAATAELVEGRDWVPISPPQPGDAADKIEVLEFFSYGCPHCRELHPLVTVWATRLPEDVALRRIPVSFGRAAWANLARLYLALELTGDLAKLDMAVFDAIHDQRAKLFTRESIVDWVKTQGVAANAFAEAFDSFAVQTRLARSDQLVRQYRIDAVPRLTVAGRYAVVGREAKGHEDLLAIADALIAQARARRTAAAAQGD
ncbi:MAG: thiol:disulfide interchange protein DsbA/DsbL [Chromatiaceae bacterium]|jgi:thiol:disulfide interchange protein DsbA|nr:thiol:disulfide interchange protein DsbA/DsbL [Chromatiaceae bacterium]